MGWGVHHVLFDLNSVCVSYTMGCYIIHLLALSARLKKLVSHARNEFIFCIHNHSNNDLHTVVLPILFYNIANWEHWKSPDIHVFFNFPWTSVFLFGIDNKFSRLEITWINGYSIEQFTFKKFCAYNPLKFIIVNCWCKMYVKKPIFYYASTINRVKRANGSWLPFVSRYEEDAR